MRASPHSRLIIGCVLMAVFHLAGAQGTAGGAPAPGTTVDSALLPAEIMPLADKSLLLDVEAMDGGFIAVGERGHVLLSTDGEAWRQAQVVPTRSTLTAVTARGDRLWAVGHDSVVIHSRDGGETWERQAASPAQSSEADPNPFFDVLFIDDDRGFVVGSYGRLLVTDDGGAQWEELLIEDLLVEDDGSDDATAEESDDDGSYESQFGAEEQYYDYHLNGIARLSDGTLFIAGEAGTSYRSMDDGASWVFFDFPYEGSMFGIYATRDDRFVAYGLRGHVFESDDGGRSWEELETGTLNSLMGGAVLRDGTEVLVGANGELLLRRMGGARFLSIAYPGGEDLGDVAPIEGMALVIVGEEGTGRFTPGAGS